MSPRYWHCQIPNHYTIMRQTGFYWVHSQKFLCKIPPVPGAECTCSSNCSCTEQTGNTKNRRKEKVILLVFADYSKGLWFVSMARESCEINPTVLSWKNPILASAADAIPCLCSTRAHKTDNLWLCCREARLHLPSVRARLTVLKTKSIFG